MERQLRLGEIVVSLHVVRLIECDAPEAVVDAGFP